MVAIFFSIPYLTSIYITNLYNKLLFPLRSLADFVYLLGPPFCVAVCLVCKLYIIVTFRGRLVWNRFCGYLLICWTGWNSWISWNEISDIVNYFSEDNFGVWFFFSWYETAGSTMINLWRFWTKHRLTCIVNKIEYVTAYVP